MRAIMFIGKKNDYLYCSQVHSKTYIHIRTYMYIFLHKSDWPYNSDQRLIDHYATEKD